jgi:hypothetical protein
MQNTRPLPSESQPDLTQMFMMEGEQAQDVGAQLTASAPGVTSPLIINAPVILFTGSHPAVTANLQGDQKGSSSLLQSTAPSLTSALQATLATQTTAHLVVIPGSGKRKPARQRKREKATFKRRMSPRLRQSIVLLTILAVTVMTLLSLAPLANGEGASPFFSGIGRLLSMQFANGQIAAHTQDQRVAAPVQSGPPPMTLPKSQYVAIAQQDATDAGISPVYFVRQINEESSFNPNAVSPAGAVGIAQFLPSTAAGLGINPWDPIQSLRGAARLMANYAKNYGGDYAKALAAYNGGSGTVQHAVYICGANWLNCLPGETRHYIYVIMGI